MGIQKNKNRKFHDRYHYELRQSKHMQKNRKTIRNRSRRVARRKVPEEMNLHEKLRELHRQKVALQRDRALIAAREEKIRVLEDEITAVITAAEEKALNRQKSGDDIRTNDKEEDKLGEDGDDEEVDDSWP